MNDKITFPRLATLLADKSGRSKRFSEDFLREFFALISEALENGESVKVRGLGTFRLSRVESRRSVDVTTGQPMEISGHSKVVFVPSKELAEAVNAPFEAFTSIEINDDADISQLFSDDSPVIQEESDQMSNDDDDQNYAYDSEKPEEVEINSNNEEENEVDNPDLTFKETESDEQDEDQREETIDDESPKNTDGPSNTEFFEVAVIPAEEVEPYEDDDTYGDEMEFDSPRTRRKNWLKTLMIALGAAVLALIATLAIWYVFATKDYNSFFNRTASNSDPAEGFIVGKTITTADSLAEESPEDSEIDASQATDEPEVPTAPSDPIVYDTISTTRYLTTMAKIHYGNFNLWPYIYEENKAKLGHPDRIRPGTPVVIPKLSKYGVDPTNKEHVDKAKKLGVEIYARYGKKI